ncbi:Fe-S cluster assembly scaffold SufA [Amorphus sp. 3PC139-8]|uniref:Fe-S cluster assembly scaffold SufA n=1 Tax=Amorphus sp. 3PC139-8 TaxID=2735676 RepID=UPI00345D4D73
MSQARPKPQVLTLTEAAAERLREIMENADKPIAGLKIGVKKGGCAGMEYTMDYVEEPNPSDDKVEQDGVTVFIDPSAVLFLLGTRMDYKIDKLQSGFVFENPNQVSACGCGESVELRPADLQTA